MQPVIEAKGLCLGLIRGEGLPRAHAGGSDGKRGANFSYFLLVFTISALMPGSSLGACSYLRSEAALTQGTKDLKFITPEILFLDSRGTRGRALIRSYQKDSDRAHPIEDIVLYNAAGQVAQIPLPDAPDKGSVPGEIQEAKAIRIRPDRESIFIAYGLRRLRWKSDSSDEWLTVIDPETCQLVGIFINNYTDRISFPTIDEEINTKDPRYEKERAYLEKVKFGRGFVTQEMVAKGRHNSKWSKYVWLLDNQSAFYDPSGKLNPKGHLKLQWYPWNEIMCLPDGHDLSYKQFRLVERDRIITICDTTKRQWATLFVADGDEETAGLTFFNMAQLTDYGQITIETCRDRVVNISLDNLEWSHSQSRGCASPGVLPKK
jgi:hypothetical protein